MAFKIILTFCSSTLLIQCIAGQCIGASSLAPLAPINEWSCAGASRAAAPLAGIAASSGGGLVVSSVSPVAPVGVSIVSDNAIEGALAVGGALPYLGAVALEAAIPTAGAGAVAYGCGNGAVSITAEDIGTIGFTGVAGPLGYVPGVTGPIAPGPGGPIAPGLGAPFASGLGGSIGFASGCGYSSIL